jgi:hypothetical protein
VQVLGINTLLSGQTAQVVQQFYVNPTGTTYPILLSGNQAGAAYGATKEDYFVIDGTGICTYRVRGYNQAAVEKALDDALATSSVPDDRTAKPENFVLEQNYPNPFNSRTIIQFQLNDSGSRLVSLKIYDLHGKEVVTLIEKNMSAGSYSIDWDGRDFNDRSVSSGIYYYSLQVGNKKELKKMTLIQ